MFRKTTLANGLRIITKKLESTKSVTVLILVGAGSRYEDKKNNGISHFLEHMFFKGAEKYKNTKEVSEAIDSVGGDFNAFTGKEYAGYFVKVASTHIGRAFDVLSDMLCNSKFDSAEIDKERSVILEEFNMYQDTPMYQIGWKFEELVYGDQPLGWDQIGTKELISNVTHDDFVKYFKSLYVPGNMVLAVTGNIEHKEVVDMIGKYFELGNEKKAFDFEAAKENKGEKRIYLKNKKTEQAHLAIGYPAYPEMHEDHWALKVLSVILGGNMSSRMFLSVREARGLAYYIHTNTDDYMDTGLISTTAGVDLKRIDLAITAILEQYEKIAFEDVPKEELKKAKEFIKGKMILKLEDSEEYAHLLGKYELLHENPKTPEEIMQAVDKVTVPDVKRVASDLFVREKAHLAVIGPYEDEDRFKELLGK
ncbi:insulinase family protein [Patescibacteria group bacterium]|nr:insulinase family protein [Patescibacteria group bacterium]